MACDPFSLPRSKKVTIIDRLAVLSARFVSAQTVHDYHSNSQIKLKITPDPRARSCNGAGGQGPDGHEEYSCDAGKAEETAEGTPIEGTMSQTVPVPFVVF